MLKHIMTAALLLTPLAANAEDYEKSRDWVYIGEGVDKAKMYARIADVIEGDPQATEARLWTVVDQSKNPKPD